MATELTHDHQFELDGYVFGYDCPVETDPSGFQPSGTTIRSSDSELPTEDGSRPGIDRKGVDTWKFSLYTNCETEEEAYAALEAIKEAWDADDVRLEPGEVCTLRYRIAGETRVVYGRPRRFTPVIDNRSLSGMIPIQCDFDVMYPQVFEDELHTVTIPIGPPIDVNAGLLVPFIPPVTLSAGASERKSEVNIGGNMKTPIILEFTGPIAAGASVQVGDWIAELVDPVGPDEDDAVTIDARPWVRSATTRNGGGVRVSPRVTRISKMSLAPGRYAVTFRGEDPTVQARVKVSWRSARRSIR